MGISDQTNFINPARAGNTAFALASRLQDQPPATQVMATAMLFLLFADEMRLPVVDTLRKARDILLDSDPYTHREIAAIKQLIREEYLK